MPPDKLRAASSRRSHRRRARKYFSTRSFASLPSKFPDPFVGLVEEARGDLLVLSGDENAAREAYAKAQASQYVANRDALNMKLDDLAVPGDAESDKSESAS